MDWRIYKAVYGVSLQHHSVGSLFSGIETASIAFTVAVTVGLWRLAPPGGSRKWKLAATAARATCGPSSPHLRMTKVRVAIERVPGCKLVRALL